MILPNEITVALVQHKLQSNLTINNIKLKSLNKSSIDIPKGILMSSMVNINTDIDHLKDESVLLSLDNLKSHLLLKPLEELKPIVYLQKIILFMPLSILWRKNIQFYAEEIYFFIYDWRPTYEHCNSNESITYNLKSSAVGINTIMPYCEIPLLLGTLMRSLYLIPKILYTSTEVLQLSIKESHESPQAAWEKHNTENPKNLEILKKLQQRNLQQYLYIMEKSPSNSIVNYVLSSYEVLNIQLSSWTVLCRSRYIYVYIYICMYVYIYIFINIFVYVYMYICMYSFTYL
jgi:hypothetical protein